MADADTTEKEKQRIRSRRWYLKNKERAIEAKRRWRKANPELHKAQLARYRKKHPETAIGIKKRYNAKHKDRIPELVKQRRKKDPMKHKLWRWRTLGCKDPTRPMPTACECCGSPPTKNRYGSYMILHLDHCHETGAFRGWLCHKCNVGIGNLGDNEAAVERALEYLRRAKCESEMQQSESSQAA